MDLNDSHIVVTGGGSGVGAECAHQLRSAGARVSIMGRTATALAAQNLPYQTCDVCKPDEVEAAFSAARADQGPITGVIANAGAAPSKPFSKMTADEFSATLDVNLAGVFHTFRAALPDMQDAGGGRMIAIASTAGVKGYPYVSGYCAAKHGVVGLVRALAIELAPQNITVNAICPGFVDTPLLERSLDMIMEKTGSSREAAMQNLIRGNPQKRLINVSEVAGSALWLCSDAARSINGHALLLSGGEI